MKTIEEKKEVAKFLCAGVIATAIDFGVYYFFMNFFPPAVSKSISFVCGGVAAFFLNKYWTFKQEEKSSSEVVRFIVANSLAFVLNVSVNEWMLNISGRAVFIALITATAVTTVFTFIVFKYWVFTAKVRGAGA